ncbi:MAG: T9SS type A sorting domain-containing protein [Bacteroidota bacterium]
MNHKFWFLTLACCLFFLPLSGQIISWQFENISDDIQESGSNPDSEVDSDGNIHVTYWNKTIDRLSYGVRNHMTGAWTFQDVPETGNFGYKSALAIDSSGLVHIAYLKNQGNQAALGLATYDGTNWTFEDASEGNTIGIYGFDFNFPTYAQPSLDLTFDAFGQPTILHFNAFFTRIKDCAVDIVIDEIYSQYRMDMNIYVRRAINNWEEITFPDQPYTGSQPCVENGDRFGEYCKILQPNDTTWIAITNSLHNNELLMFKSHDDSLKNWTQYSIDRSFRLPNISIFNQHFYEGFGYIDAKSTNDSIVHLTYSLTNHYGYGRNLFTDRLTYFYTRVNLNQLDQPGYEPYYFNLNPTNQAAFDNSIEALDDSTVVIVFNDRVNGTAVSVSSNDGGVNWRRDTLQNFFTSNPFSSVKVEDSLFVFGYFSAGDRLDFGKTTFNDPGWEIQNLTNTITTGFNIASTIRDNNGQAQVLMASQARETDRLFYWENNGSEWVSEAIDISGGGISEVSMDLNNQNQPVIAYLATDSSEIRFARQLTGGAWLQEIVTDTILAKDLNIIQQGVQTDLFFFNLNVGWLQQFSRSTTQGNWTSTIIDSSSTAVGSNVASVLDEEGGFHLVYTDISNNVLKYAYKSTSSNWEVQTIEEVNNFFPTTLAIAVDTLNLPVIAFTDGQRDSVYVLNTLDRENWDTDKLDGEYIDFSASELGLIVDDQNQVWVLYDFPTFIREIRLYFRKPSGFWQQVSVNNNSTEISSVFDFKRYQNDLYILGRKNQVNNSGLGYLYGPSGIEVQNETLLSEQGLSIGPNPSRDFLNIHWKKEINQPTSVSLYNLEGRLVYHSKEARIAPGIQRIDMDDLKAGLYIVKIDVAGEVLTEKILHTP